MLHPELPAPTTHRKVDLKVTHSVPDYRFMYMKNDAKADGNARVSFSIQVLDALIVDMADKMKEAYGFETYNHPGLMCDEKITVVGRVCAADGGDKVNDKSIVLETSRELGNGCRVPLNLQAIQDSTCLFPGQVKPPIAHQTL